MATSIVVVAGLALAGTYGYVEWKLTKIKSVRCDTCKAAPPGKPFNVLVVGSDTRAGDTGAAAKSFGSAAQVGGQRSDTIKIVHVDPASGTARVLSIPRDTFVSLSGMPSDSQLATHNKINTAFDAGILPLIGTIQNTLGIPINHFVTIDFSGVINLVNAVGGVSLNFPYPVRDNDAGNNNSGLSISQPGCQVLNGNQALALSRSRYYQYYANGYWHGDPSSDLGRIERQNIVMSSLIDKAKGDLNPLELNSLLNAVVGDITKDTGLSGNDLISLATHYKAFSGSSLQTWTLPTVGASSSYAGAVEVVQEPQAQQVISQFLGGPPTLPVVTPPLNSYGNPLEVSSAAAVPTSTPSSLAVQSVGSSPTTTIPQETPTGFDPTPC